MATVIRTAPFRGGLLPPPVTTTTTTTKSIPFKSAKSFSISFRQKTKLSSPALFCPRFTTNPWPPLRFSNLLPFASPGETETETETTIPSSTETDQQQQTIQDSELTESSDGDVVIEDAANAGGDDGVTGEEILDSDDTPSVIMSSLQSYKEALTCNDESKIAEIEAFLRSIEDEKTELEKKVATLTDEMSTERDRVLRISADFDNFRKRTDRERLSLVENAQGELVESLLPVMDNFERAKAQIKAETEGEQKINNSYQSIYKQFIEIVDSLGVVHVDTIGKPFDPMLHEAIMREDSAEFEEGIVLEEYRKGFRLGDRLLRPSMVKVSAGPGPVKPEEAELSQESESPSEISDESSIEAESSS